MHSPIPAGPCDCHVHIIGPAERFPQSAGRTYTACPAALESLQAAAKPAGISRFVIVQPSFYGSDNSCLLASLEALGPRGRGVIVADPDALTPEQLADYARQGVCGIRVNLYRATGVEAPKHLRKLLEKFTGKLPTAGWHIEVIATLPFLAAAAAEIRGSAVPIVIDHYGLPGNAQPDGHDGRALLDLLSLSHVWVKLSAPYRVVSDPLATQPPSTWLEAFTTIAPDRCVWGSDWPHTPPLKDQHGVASSPPYREISYQQALSNFLDALPQPGLAQRILQTNPARLFAFPASG